MMCLKCKYDINFEIINYTSVIKKNVIYIVIIKFIYWFKSCQVFDNNVYY